MFVRKDVLVNALATVKKSIPAKATLEVLKYVSLWSDGDTLHVRGTDLETFTDATINCFETNEEDVCVFFPTFSQAVQALDDGEISLQATESMLVVEQGKTKLEFPILPGMEFPFVPVMDDRDAIQLETVDVLLAFARVIHAAATDESRPTLTGVYVSLANRVLTTTCADGFRMAVSNLSVDTDKTFTSLLPSKSVASVLAALPDEGEVEIVSDVSRVRFSLPEKEGVLATIYCQMIQGSYVNFKQIIPQQGQFLLLDKEDLAASLKVGRVFAKGNANIIKHVLGDDELALHAYSPEDGMFDRLLPASFHGEQVEFGINFSYEVDALSVLSGIVAIESSSPNRPIVMYEEGKRGEFLCVLMPMHIRK